MATVVIGGHTRNIGKTSVVAGLIAALPDLHWTAIKITQYGHGVCSANGDPCDCETADHTIAVSEERDSTSGTDTSRYLAAGAVKSLWVRTRQGQLSEAMPAIRRELAKAENAIIESNSVLRFLRPDVFISVLDPATLDFKPSAKQYLDRADAIVIPESGLTQSAWPDISLRLVARAQRFLMRPPHYVDPTLIAFLRTRMDTLHPIQEI